MNRIKVIAMSELIERRKHSRIKIRLEIRYEKEGKISIYNKTITKDMSTEGMGMEMDRFIRPGDKVKFEMKIPGYYLPVVGMASIVWTVRKDKDKKDRPGTAAGLRFTQINDCDRKKIVNCLKEEGNKEMSDLKLGRSDISWLQPTP